MEEELVNRKKPMAAEAEAAVIGSMIMGEEAIAEATNALTKDDFYSKTYAMFFEAIVSLSNDNRSVDTITLIERLKSMGAPSDVCTADYITQLLMDVPVSSRIKEYVSAVKNASLLRHTIDVAKVIEDMCYSQQSDPADVIDEAQKKFMDLLSFTGETTLSDISAIARDTLLELEALSKRKGKMTGVPSGFHDLDFMTNGFQKSALILIAARPAMGKTAFVLNIAQYAVLKANVTTAIFSLEMSQGELFKRLLASESNVEGDKLKKGNIGDSDWPRLIKAASSYGKTRLFLEDDKNPTLADIRRKCRKLKYEANLGLVIIDYLQLMNEEGNQRRSRQEFIASVSRGLKNLARELDVPIIALSQLSRKVEERDDKRPILSDLRESGSIEQDADMVMFLYRDDYYNSESAKKGITELIIAKHRSGEVGKVELAWIPNYTKFANLDKSDKTKKYDKKEPEGKTESGGKLE